MAETAVVVCARANHPRGYGNERTGEAHGYVLLFVTDVPGDCLEVLRARLREPVGADVWGGPWAEWYGGIFEPVALLQGVGPADASGPYPVDTALRSIGDNRAYATVAYSDLVQA